MHRSPCVRMDLQHLITSIKNSSNCCSFLASITSRAEEVFLEHDAWLKVDLEMWNAKNMNCSSETEMSVPPYEVLKSYQNLLQNGMKIGYRNFNTRLQYTEDMVSKFWYQGKSQYQNFDTSPKMHLNDSLYFFCSKNPYDMFMDSKTN